LGAESAITIFRLQHGASGPHHERAIKNKTVGFDQRPRPLHNRYTRTDNFARWEMAVAYGRYKFVTVSLPKRSRNGRFTSETPVPRLLE
jgi:hypothetical protein